MVCRLASPCGRGLTYSLPSHDCYHVESKKCLLYFVLYSYRLSQWLQSAPTVARAHPTRAVLGHAIPADPKFFAEWGVRGDIRWTRKQTWVEKHLTAANYLYISGFWGLRLPDPTGAPPWTPLGDFGPLDLLCPPWLQSLATPLNTAYTLRSVSLWRFLDISVEVALET